RHRPVTDFPWKPQRRSINNQPPPPPERAKTCGPCKVKRVNRRRPLQEGATVPEAVPQPEGPTPPALQPADMMNSSSRRCTTCKIVRPAADFALRRPNQPNQSSQSSQSSQPSQSSQSNQSSQPNQPPQRLKTCRQCR
ncbi:hypothetical protein E4U39_006999, partial [Claviceps sp. Clav50 group G5]